MKARSESDFITIINGQIVEEGGVFSPAPDFIQAQRRTVNKLEELFGVDGGIVARQHMRMDQNHRGFFCSIKVPIK